MSFRSSGSYKPSNASVVGARDFNGPKVGRPIRIRFGYPMRKGNPLAEWYDRLEDRCRMIQTIQLRKEHEGPFFHEFIVFRLHNNGGYFRLERRQLPTEDIPLDCMAKVGVEAHDTLEEIRGFGDACLDSSDCLIEVELKFGLHVLRLIRACQAIQNHREARMYTLQRFNCYFFAQTMIFCGVSSMLGKDSHSEPVKRDDAYAFSGEHMPAADSLVKKPLHVPRPPLVPQRSSLSMSTISSRPVGVSLQEQLRGAHVHLYDGIDIKIMDRIPELPEQKRSGGLSSKKAQDATWKAGKLLNGTHEALQKYLEQLVDAHAQRVGRIPVMIGSYTPPQLAEDIVAVMHGVWQEIKA